MDIWNRRRAKLVEKYPSATKAGLLESAISKKDKPIKLSECHDFAWSRTLWRAAAEQAAALILKLVVVFLFVGYWTMAFYDPYIANGNGFAINGWYFLSATVTTVGLGDFAPSTQLGRGFAIVMVPAGLVVLSMVLAGMSMYSKSKTPVLKQDAQASKRVEDARMLFRAIDANNDGVLTRQEVLDKAEECLKTSQEEAGKLFDSLDSNLSGTLEMHDFMSEGKNSSQPKILCRCIFMLLKLYGTIFLGALFFKLNSKFWDESFLTWVDCFYWGAVVSTSIGYGDITPSTYAGKLFLTFYMLLSTVVVGQVLGDFISLYVNDVVTERINAQIIESTIWVHKMDISDPSAKTRHGFLSEADYVLFKLIQMQKVDDDVVERLIDCFFKIDTEGSGSLVLGVEAPNREQVAEMKVMTEGTGMTLQEAWHKHLTKAYRLRAEVHLPDKVERPAGGSFENKNDGDADNGDSSISFAEAPRAPSISRPASETSRGRKGKKTVVSPDGSVGPEADKGTGLEMPTIPNPFGFMAQSSVPPTTGTTI